MYLRIHRLNSSPILELSVEFTSQICHENTNKPRDGAYLANFGTDFSPNIRQREKVFSTYQKWSVCCACLIGRDKGYWASSYVHAESMFC